MRATASRATLRTVVDKAYCLKLAMASVRAGQSWLDKVNIHEYCGTPLQERAPVTIVR